MLCRKGSKMDEVSKELDELKIEFQKFREQCRIKLEISESLRISFDEQLAKSEEEKLQVEMQSGELYAKLEEIAELSQLYEQAKTKLHETEASLKKVSSLNDKIRIDSVEKVEKLEGDNVKLVSALGEATGRNDDLERKLQTSSEEIAGLKGCLSELQRKCSEAEEKVRVGKELRHREDVIVKQEEQSMTVQDHLKWKKERFQHLEEAHRQLQDQFQLSNNLEEAHRQLQDQFELSNKEWAFEKSTLLEEMTKLQSDLDSQIRISEGLESRLKMCNQALAHEESKRKLLEVELSESKQCFDNVLSEYEEAKTEISPKKKGTKVTKVSWNPHEEEALVFAYLETSQDLEHGTIRTEKNFWRTVLERYDEARASKPQVLRERTGGVIRSKWRRIQLGVSAWLRCYDKACLRTQGRSGHNEEEDIIKEAHLIYAKSFTYDHCWRLMRTVPRWRDHLKKKFPGANLKSQDKGKGRANPNMPLLSEDSSVNTTSTSSAKRSRVDVYLDELDDGTQTSRQPKRPMGNKAAKNYGKRKNLAYDLVEKPSCTLDQLTTRTMCEVHVADKKIELAKIKTDAKLEAIRQRREIQIINRKYDMLISLNTKPVLNEHDIQLKIKLMRELGYSD